jgi:peptide/nickel transport system permease protein
MNDAGIHTLMQWCTSRVGFAAARPPRRSASSLNRSRRFTSLTLGVLLTGLISIAALAAPWLAPADPIAMDSAARLQPPSLTHPFGTDRYGRDVLSRVLYAGRLDLGLSLLAVLFCAGIAVPLAVIAGYYRGWIDRLISTGMEIWLTVPGLLLAIVMVAGLGASLRNAMLAIAIMSVPGLFRAIRGCMLSAAETGHVEAARAIGARNRRIIWRHVFPGVLSNLIVLVTLRVGIVLLSAGGLSFIGLGAQPPQPEWGALLAEGRAVMHSAWWLATFPGLAITLTVVGVNLLGDGLRDVLSPFARGATAGFVAPHDVRYNLSHSKTGCDCTHDN